MLHTSGNGNEKDLIYHIYGRDIAASVLELKHECEFFKVHGYIGKPIITRGNRNYENYFINGRYIKSNLLSKAIEEAYKNFLMQHQYPFTVLYFDFFGESLDVNVHPTKMELRFDNNTEVYKELCDAVFEKLSHKEMIPEVPLEEEKSSKKIVHEYKEPIPEPFETRRLNDILRKVDYSLYKETSDGRVVKVSEAPSFSKPENIVKSEPVSENFLGAISDEVNQKYDNISLQDISDDFLTKDAKKKHKIIGQLFDTYWLIEYEDKLFIIDQHAAHEKVLYERTMNRLKDKEFTSQTISPPIVMSLDANEVEMLNRHKEQIERMGYVVEPFGGKEYMISAIPDNLFNVDMKDLFIEMLDDFSNISGKETPELILEKVASMSCKAAVKGNDKLSLQEIDSLVEELLTLDNPYNCPHGRPTIISMTKYEIEKKFKRIV